MSKLQLNGTTVISDENSTKTSLFTDNVTFPSGHVIKTSNYENATSAYIAGGAREDASTPILWRFNVIKKLGASDSNLFVIAQLNGLDNNSDYCGVFCTMDNAIASEGGIANDEGGYRSTGYCGADGNNESFVWATLKKFSSIPAGTHEVRFGWHARNNNTGESPFAYWNVNDGKDIRQPQSASTCQILEVKI